MGWWLVSADTLAESRFVVSPLAEVTATLKTLERGTAANPGERIWLDTHLPAYRTRRDSDPITASLIRAALSGTWNADFFTPTLDGDDEPTFAQELAGVRATPPDQARADVTVSLGGPLPDRLNRADLPERAADVLQWVWTQTVHPYWPRRRRIIEADVIARIAQLAQGGWVAALGDMHSGMRWLGNSRLQVNTHDYPPMEISEARLMFVPVTPRQGWVSWESHRYAVVYPCSGALAEQDRVIAPEPLRALLGPVRATVLILLDSPKSTTQLVALTGQGLGSVGRHLKILFDAGLIRRRRVGRSVLYYRAAAGEILVRAQSDR